MRCSPTPCDECGTKHNRVICPNCGKRVAACYIQCAACQAIVSPSEQCASCGARIAIDEDTRRHEHEVNSLPYLLGFATLLLLLAWGMYLTAARPISHYPMVLGLTMLAVVIELFVPRWLGVVLAASFLAGTWYSYSRGWEFAAIGLGTLGVSMLYFECQRSIWPHLAMPRCPMCNEPLRSRDARQCLECGHDWHV